MCGPAVRADWVPHLGGIPEHWPTAATARLSTAWPTLRLMKVVVRFDPPDAHASAREWREQHAAALSALPDEAVQIVTGRAVGGGDFVQIRVANEYADRFADD